MYCNKCGKALFPGAMYCLECGVRLDKYVAKALESTNTTEIETKRDDGNKDDSKINTSSETCESDSLLLKIAEVDSLENGESTDDRKEQKIERLELTEHVKNIDFEQNASDETLVSGNTINELEKIDNEEVDADRLSSEEIERIVNSANAMLIEEIKSLNTKMDMVLDLLSLLETKIEDNKKSQTSEFEKCITKIKLVMGE